MGNAKDENQNLSVRCIERPEKGLCSGSKWMSDCETMAIVQVWNKVLLS